MIINTSYSETNPPVHSLPTVTAQSVTVFAARCTAVTIKKEIRTAILLHIRALRTLGHMETNTQQIADALFLSLNEVNRTIGHLKTFGVFVK
jgi:hypothetical protein